MVLGAGALGIVAYAWYKNRQSTPSTSPTATDYTGQVPSQDQFIPPYQQFQTSGAVDLNQLPPMDNPAWSSRVQSILVDIGFDPGLVADAVGKFLNRQPLNSTEADLIRSAIAYVGPPPAGQFSIIGTTPTAVTSTTTALKHHYAVERHIPTVRTGVRAYVKQYSDAPVATPNNVQTATIATMGDPRNVTAGVQTGWITAKHPVYLHVVKAG